MEAIQAMRKALMKGREFLALLDELSKIDRDYIFYGLDNEDLLNDTDNILDILARKIKRLEHQSENDLENTELIEALGNALMIENRLFFVLQNIAIINADFIANKFGRDIRDDLKKIRYFLSNKKQEAKELNAQ